MSKRRGPEVPADLQADAKARWVSVYPTLAARGPVDAEKLKTYCQVWARWRVAEDAIAKSGILVKGRSGRVEKSPLVALASSAAATVRSLETQLGIGAEPASETAGLLTRRELATRMSVHMMTVTKWERYGMPIAIGGRKGKPSWYDEAEVRAWLAAREASAQTGNGSEPIDVARERARKDRAQALLAEQLFSVRSGKLLDAVDVEKAWMSEIAAARAVILNSYTAAADRVFRACTLDGLSGVERELKAIAYGVLRELSSASKVGAA